MPKEFLQAHRQNDRAVMAAYGFSTKMTESECVAELFKRHAKIVEERICNISQQGHLPTISANALVAIKAPRLSFLSMDNNKLISLTYIKLLPH